MTDQTLTYAKAGVNIGQADKLVEDIKHIADKTKRPGILQGIGGFGALFEIPSHYKQPILVSGTDGVGTKLKLAIELNKHDTIGIDLVAMCANDILCQGAEPLFFLDYFACGQLSIPQAKNIMTGIGKGCELAGCALIGGETAEMPGMYQGEDYDLAGFCVGVVEKTGLIDGSKVQPQNCLIALASSGPHANGYSLIRRVIEKTKIELSDLFMQDTTFGEILLTPTKIYAKSVSHCLSKINPSALAHITGGGIIENLPRVLPDHCQAIIHKNSWNIPDIFQWLQSEGNIAELEMFRTFNMGVGMVLVVANEQAADCLQLLNEHGENAWIIGEVTNRSNNDAPVVIR